MNKIIMDQLNMMKTLEFQVDGKPSKDFPEFFNEVTFKKTTKDIVDTREKQFVFADYILHPYPGFDLHEKFNKGIIPPEQIMQGQIVKETERMYCIKAHTLDNSKDWFGWIPKKSVKID